MKSLAGRAVLIRARVQAGLGERALWVSRYVPVRGFEARPLSGAPLESIFKSHSAKAKGLSESEARTEKMKGSEMKAPTNDCFKTIKPPLPPHRAPTILPHPLNERRARGTKPGCCCSCDFLRPRQPGVLEFPNKRSDIKGACTFGGWICSERGVLWKYLAPPRYPLDPNWNLVGKSHTRQIIIKSDDARHTAGVPT